MEKKTKYLAFFLVFFALFVFAPLAWAKAPSHVSATDVSNSGAGKTEIIVNWEDSGASSYAVYRGTSSSNLSQIIFDFFAGSGTTIATAHKSHRRWIGIEMGEHFEKVIIPRMKEVLSGKSNREPCGISKDVNWQGGGFFKYYELEQYENILQTIEYNDTDIKNFYENLSKMDKNFSKYQANPFIADKKLLKVIEIDEKNKKVKINLSKLYPDKQIDIAESLSNITGRKIIKIRKNYIELEGEEPIKLDNLDYKKFKKLLWWE